jgi:hypothetical protein
MSQAWGWFAENLNRDFAVLQNRAAGSISVGRTVGSSYGSDTRLVTVRDRLRLSSVGPGLKVLGSESRSIMRRDSDRAAAVTASGRSGQVAPSDPSRGRVRAQAKNLNIKKVTIGCGRKES